MSHSDPLFMIPTGTVIVVVCLYMLVKPEVVHTAAREWGGWARTLESIFGRRGALWVLRAAAVVTALVTARAVIHASRALAGT